MVSAGEAERIAVKMARLCVKLGTATLSERDGLSAEITTLLVPDENDSPLRSRR